MELTREGFFHAVCSITINATLLAVELQAFSVNCILSRNREKRPKALLQTPLGRFFPLRDKTRKRDFCVLYKRRLSCQKGT